MLYQVKDAAHFLRTAGPATSLKALAWHTSEWRQEHHYGIHSDRFVAASALSGDAAENEAYEATGYETLREVFERIGPRDGDPPEVLLDAGCGMGRVMIVAATRPYRRVVGFDISPMLVEQAVRNFEHARRSLRCTDLQATVANAVEYPVPDDVTAVFCFNPFTGKVMSRFLAQVRASLGRHPRRLRMAFANPPESFGDAAWMRLSEQFDCFDPRMGIGHAWKQRVMIFEALS